MSGQINKLKSKINSTKTTKKITKAMELVSRSKMRLFQDKALTSKKFENNIIELIKKTYDKETKNRYTINRSKGDVFFVLFTSDKGLCGAMNFKLINTLTTSNAWLNTPKQNRQLILIGKKGLEFAKSHNLNVFKYFNDLSDQLQTTDLIDIIDQILTLWDKKTAKEIYMVVPEYLNTMVYYPRLQKFLPAVKQNYSDLTNNNQDSNINNIENDFNKSNQTFENNTNFENDTQYKNMNNQQNIYDEEVFIKNIVYEPNSKFFLDNLFNKLIYSRFMSAFVNLKATEYSSRMIAMKNATDSANDMIDKYTLSYNRARQSSITQEIAEIVGANL